MSKQIKKIGFVWALLWLPWVSMAESDATAIEQEENLHIIQLENRSADELIPIVNQLIKGRGSATGIENKLFLRANDAVLAEVHALISELDSAKAAPKQYIITVIQGEREAVKRTIYQYHPQQEVEAQISSTRSKEVRDHQVRVMSGQPAQIRMGQSIPTVGHAYIDPFGSVPYQGASLVYRDIYSGMTVIPTQRGEQIELVINAQKQNVSSMDAGKIETRDVQTTLLVNSGEWVEMAGADRRDHISHSQFAVRRATRAKDSNYTVFIRVDQVDNIPNQ